MSLINISNLTFCYDGSFENVFENVSFQIDTDWKLGFTGRNGRGKTTFLKLLTGKYPYKGTISSSVEFDYFPFEVDQTEDTQNVVQQVCVDYEPWQLERELSLLEVDDEVLDRPFHTLSNGERTKVLLAALFLKRNNFLLIDEPTNHLDMNARKVVGSYLKRKKGFILVSHDRAFLDQCIDHILSINRTDIEVQKGNFSSWQHNKDLKDGFEMAQNEKLKKEINRMSEAAKQASGWSDKVEKTKFGTTNSGSKPDRGYVGHKAAKMMKRSKSIETRRQRALMEKADLLKNVETSVDLCIRPLQYHASRLAEIKGLSISYVGRTVCENVDLVVNSKDRIALLGKNGCGKSSILKLMAGEDICFSGHLAVGSNLKISYIPQDTSFLRGNLSDFARENNIDESIFKSTLRNLDFSRSQFEKDMSEFSSGQKKKVLIAKSLCERAHLYVWDEPLNFVDVLSRIQLEKLILSYQPSMLFVEHDASFVTSVATKVVQM